MPDYVVGSFAELGRHLNALLKKKEARIKKALESTAKYGAKQIAILAPIAFEDLKESIHVYGSTIVVDAPHAAAVEMGSRPHTPPLEPLIKWVKLRGMQGLTATGKVKSVPKVTFGSVPLETGQRRADFHSRTVARAIRAFRFGKGAISANAPEYVARAIQKAIMISGTKPTFFVRNSLPAIEQELLSNLKEAMGIKE